MTLTGNILITGGSGTLGAAIVRTAQRENWPCTFTIYSRSELRQAQMRAKYPHCRYVLGDVRDYDRLAAAVAGHDLVIHAAALKRIPECEQHPTECYQTNVQGSANVVRACIASGIKRCVGISTDKACRSVTCYGHSKGMLEKLFQAAPAFGPCTFTLVRYGNVVASNGSVIPLWRDQAKRGEPLTITDPEMTRFWMAESEAVKLIEWACGAAHGRIAVPKMGALSIGEMAAIVAPGADHRVTGLRSIEKRHEDLVHEDEAAHDTGSAFLLATNASAHYTTGHRYTSYAAPRLTRDQFLAMLEEAESHE